MWADGSGQRGTGTALKMDNYTATVEVTGLRDRGRGGRRGREEEQGGRRVGVRPREAPAPQSRVCASGM